MIHESFVEILGEPETRGKIDVSVLQTTYAGALSHFADSDVLLEYLEHYGEAVFKGGIFSFINPTDYEELLNSFPKLRGQAIMPFAKTAMGNFYLIGELDGETCLTFYNIQTEEHKYVDNEFSFFFKRLAGNKPNMENEAYGLVEFPALEQYGPVAIDECLTFVPALVLGGEEDLRNIQKVKLKPNLQLLAQAFS